MLRMLIALFGFFACLGATVKADGPGDNDPTDVRQVPKAGVELPAADRDFLETKLKVLEEKLRQLSVNKDARVQELIPDVEILQRAVRCALDHDEFLSNRDIARGREIVVLGIERADQLLTGNAPWTTAAGLVVRGFRSKLDNTVQPYGLVIPDNYSSVAGNELRCDIWLHGRGENDMEVSFIDKRRKQVGRYAPVDTIVLHPYGRYSNAFKFAGEVDVFEALDHVRANYRIDPERISIRGFSMGGAGCWQFAVHYSDQWFAANPGAGFAETPRFLNSFQQETLRPKWFERKLWRLYDCDLYARNLRQCPTIAYSGELDIQKQAADVMEAAYGEFGKLTHLIGPQTKHTIHPDSMVEIERRMETLARRGRHGVPESIHFSTHTLKYNSQNWLTIDALQEHWEPASVHAQIGPVRGLENAQRIEIDAGENVAALSLHFPPGGATLRTRLDGTVTVRINRQNVARLPVASDQSLDASFEHASDGWRAARESTPTTLRKRHNLQGPIDDAFMGPFIFVPPDRAGNSKLDRWVDSEFERAVREWRRHFRGDARVKAPIAVSDDDLARANIVLWGNAASNSLLARIADQLPIGWTDESIRAGDRTYAAANHALIMIYPNPLNPKRYVVLNSGFTYREYAYLNNARQVPVLPDWAVINLDEPPGTQFPGGIADADFFDEKWQLKFSPENTR